MQVGVHGTPREPLLIKRNDFAFLVGGVSVWIPEVVYFDSLLLLLGDGQGSLECCSPWGHKESDTTEQLN